MSARGDDAYAKSNKQTPRYYSILSNSKYYSGSILNQTCLTKNRGSWVNKKHLISIKCSTQWTFGNPPNVPLPIIYNILLKNTTKILKKRGNL